MKRFSELLDRLVYTPARTGKLRLLVDYFQTVPDPDRGWALAALTDGLPFSFPVRRLILEMMTRRLDPELFRLSRDYVGDTAETVALLWPDTADRHAELRLADVITELQLIDRNQLGLRLEIWLDALDQTGRFALLKLLTGALRIGVSARLAKTALAEMSNKPLDDIEQVWHGLTPPYLPLFAWLDGKAPKPESSGAAIFRPVMLANPLDTADWDKLDISEFAAEWKWDGIRIQIAAKRSTARIFTRTGEDIGRSFPDLIEGFAFDAVLDGELLIVRNGVVQPFNDLQQRLNRKSVTKRMLADYPAHVRIYDALELDGDDIRENSFSKRRMRLEAWHRTNAPPRTDLSELLPAATKAELEHLRAGTRAAAIEGVMLKRRESPYLIGRPKGHWYKWKRTPQSADCVLMYAQRGSGKRSSFYSDYTFGVWRTSPAGDEELVPVGKAYSGFTDEELQALDKFIRANTIDRFGPVRSVDPTLVLEVTFDALQRSARHKSGVAMRFPRISRIRWDKPAREADRLETLEMLIERR